MKCKQNVPCQNEAAEKEQFKSLILRERKKRTQEPNNT